MGTYRRILGRRSLSPWIESSENGAHMSFGFHPFKNQRQVEKPKAGPESFLEEQQICNQSEEEEEGRRTFDSNRKRRRTKIFRPLGRSQRYSVLRPEAARVPPESPRLQTSRIPSDAHKGPILPNNDFPTDFDWR
ncbi:hypothetical protein NE237_026057 [Protea cynaroides]|uniref:Uncharacterized protein n=1 Tax=Protea cynaroides TaxID=273540 RepID=A0A9Q0H5E7_9MAGN|nr:hypothetical protein NE237_026057 [Protea cynaroides]